MVFGKFKKAMSKEDFSDDFIEIDTENQTTESKIYIKTFTLNVYEDINPILNCLREGYSIAVIDIKSLKSKDVVELKRAISKVKKTVEALEGKIAGFGENMVIATPSKVFEIRKGGAEVREAPSSSDEIERF